MKEHRKEKREAEKTSFFNGVLEVVFFSLPWDFESVRLLRTPVASLQTRKNRFTLYLSIPFTIRSPAFPSRDRGARVRF